MHVNIRRNKFFDVLIKLKENLLKYLCCPLCEENLILSIYLKKGIEIVDGLPKCEKCKGQYFIIDGIPRFIKKHYFNNLSSYNSFLRKYKIDLNGDAYEIKGIEGIENSKLDDLKVKTSSYFGYEWQYFNEWGWISEVALTDEERKY